MAHIVASITVFVNAPPLSAAEGTPLQTQGLPDALFPRENGGQQVMFFWHLHCLTPNKVAHLIRNRDRLLIEQIQATVFINQICS